MYPASNSSSTRPSHSPPPGSTPTLIAAPRTTTYGAGCPRICLRMCCNIARAFSLIFRTPSSIMGAVRPPGGLGHRTGAIPLPCCSSDASYHTALYLLKAYSSLRSSSRVMTAALNGSLATANFGEFTFRNCLENLDVSRNRSFGGGQEGSKGPDRPLLATDETLLKDPRLFPKQFLHALR